MHVATRTSDLSGLTDAILVPTMGALHEGHRVLIRHAAGGGRRVAVSIFVNPTQFGENSDLDAYPRTLEADLAACLALGVDLVFVPPVAVVYPPEAPVPVPPLPTVATRPGLEDAHRPGHFAGVCQVVARLFDLLRPAGAVFGEKDYQQLLVIRAMVAAAGDRWPGLAIEAVPTVREPEGLALSSRNVRIPAERRDAVLSLSRAVRAAAEATTPADAEAAMAVALAADGVDIEYAVVRDAETLDPVGDDSRPCRALVAARVAGVRLIDNGAVG